MWASISSTIDAPHAGPSGEPDEARGFEHALGKSADAPRLLLFTAANRTCACEIGSVREIIPYRRATRLPGAPSYVIGLINLRGSIVTVLDLGVRLGGAPMDQQRGSIILVESHSRVVGLGVNELRDVQRVSRAAIEEVDHDPASERLVCGILRADSDVAVLLDVGRIVGLALL